MKERLTGAVILVALIVLVVPELLSGPARRATETPGVADEPPLRSVTLDLGDETRSTPGARTDGGDLSAAPRAALMPAPVVPTASEPARSAQSASSEATAPAAVPPQPASPARAHRVTRAEPHAATHAPAAAHAHTSASAGWSVQVGSFESRERADRFVQRLRAAGFAAFISESVSHGRKWYRVRVGPERDRVAARAMVVRLQSAGHTGSIVPP